MTTTKRNSTAIDLPEVNGAFVGITHRPFTRAEFQKIKTILARKRKQHIKPAITNRDLGAAGLGYLVVEARNGKARR